ncbi:hypothetical protein [Christiangramia sp. SM2212]|uniref:Membrane or secreted protein n=1 Tax=Christiangramia sediminicola TaxID=3073267 RepID=A0ABU1ET17_9FLAO|nr:hypothetical protein [Christiangramia sp. SM2212]MDR5591535.1 hypothetical protein [Christiangramia sp. SM2212]
MMKHTLILLLVLLIGFTNYAQSLNGSWKLVEEYGKEVSDKIVKRIYQDNYFAETAKDSSSDEFLWALGGEYKPSDYSFLLDFNTKSPEVVGESTEADLEFTDDDKIEITTDNSTQIWERISDDNNDLDGNWVITGRKRDGVMNTMKPGDRRTIKILGGERFQWVAFNSATKEFYGTGGGTYTAENGVYTESIDVFSRDKSRIGASLEFDYELKDGEWHHSGKSSKGDPIYEIWSKYAKAYKK